MLEKVHARVFNLNENGNTMEGATKLPFSALRIQGTSLSEKMIPRSGRDHRVYRLPGSIVPVDLG